MTGLRPSPARRQLVRDKLRARFAKEMERKREMKLERWLERVAKARAAYRTLTNQTPEGSR